MDGIAKACEQRQARVALAFVLVVHGHVLEKLVDRPAQPGQRGHCGFELFCLDGGGYLRLRRVERVDQDLFGLFGRVGKGFCTITFVILNLFQDLGRS